MKSSYVAIDTDSIATIWKVCCIINLQINNTSINEQIASLITSITLSIAKTSQLFAHLYN